MIDLYVVGCKGHYLTDIIRGEGCSRCNYRGYTVTTYRDEVRDEETYWTCLYCIPSDVRERIEKKLFPHVHERPLRAEDI